MEQESCEFCDSFNLKQVEEDKNMKYYICGDCGEITGIDKKGG